MIADNNLDPFSVLDIKEMAKVGSGDSVEVLIEIDRISQGQEHGDPLPGVGDFTDARRLRVVKGQVEELEILGEKDLSQPSELAKFISWGIGRAPADHVALVLWDHGGAETGYGVDETSGGPPMSISGIATALKDGLGGKKLDILGFDACLMGQIEVAHALAPYARYFVASEESEPGPGWEWSAVVSMASTRPTPEALAASIPSSYVAGINAQAPKAADALTLAAIDLDKIGAVWDAQQALGQAVMDAVTAGNAAGVARAFADADRFAVAAAPLATDLAGQSASQMILVTL